MDARNQPCPASTHCWSGWLDTASVAESQGRE
jgi:hypothetical protein